MSIESINSQPINSQYTKVDVKYKKGEYHKNYIIPNMYTKSFKEDYTKFDKKASIITNTSFAGSILATVMLASKLSNGISNKILKWGTNIVAGIGGAIIGTIGSSKYIENKHSSLLQKYGAKEIK